MGTFEEVEWFAKRATEMEQHDPALRELKENMRAATAHVRRACTDEEMASALQSENEAIQALLEYVATKHRN